MDERGDVEMWRGVMVSWSWSQIVRRIVRSRYMAEWIEIVLQRRMYEGSIAVNTCNRKKHGGDTNPMPLDNTWIRILRSHSVVRVVETNLPGIY